VAFSLSCGFPTGGDYKHINEAAVKSSEPKILNSNTSSRFKCASFIKHTGLHRRREAETIQKIRTSWKDA
jgi:hypothetical protein